MCKIISITIKKKKKQFIKGTFTCVVNIDKNKTIIWQIEII